MKQKLVRLSALIGIIVFAFLIYKIGPDQIWKNISKISLQNFMILVALRIVYWMVRTWGWKEILDAYEGRVSFFQLFIARMCGHAVSQLTPTAQVGSEATRIFMANCSSRRICVASVIIDKTVEFLTVVFFVIIGVALLFYRITLPVKLKTFFLIGVALSTALVLLLFLKQKKGLLTWMVRLIGKIKIKPKWVEKNKEKIEETDRHISEFYKVNRLAFLRSLLVYSLLIMIWVFEIHVALIFIGVHDFAVIESFIVTTLGNLGLMFPLIPGSLGVYEATYVGLFALLGKPAGVAVTLVLIRRVIALLLAGFGLLGMLKPIPSNKQ